MSTLFARFYATPRTMPYTTATFHMSKSLMGALRCWSFEAFVSLPEVDGDKRAAWHIEFFCPEPALYVDFMFVAVEHLRMVMEVHPEWVAIQWQVRILKLKELTAHGEKVR